MLRTLTLVAVLAWSTAAINWQPGNWANNCDFKGNDLKNVRAQGSQCGGLCWSTSGCTHFTWTNHKGGTCWLKKGSCSKNSAVSKGGATCGFTKCDGGGGGGNNNNNNNNNGGGGGGGGGAEGKTTRYWDCCKPSCAWPGKNEKGSLAKTCAKDGVSPVSPNEKNSCDGGGAYVCNSQQPFAINDNLAYGFAAASIPGKREQQWCCACYRLTFTSGPVAGKQMIVQVTNTGGDLGGGHFDIQIPGGGLGIFNGCSPQWGAPGNGWGSRYGGISSVSGCNQLPRQLQSGCRFRFGWFKNADNPKMKYEQVKCPSELVQRSGCNH